MYEPYYDIISTSGLFRDIEMELVEKLLCEIEPRIVSYKRDDVIRSEDHPLTDCGFVLRGRLLLIRYLENGVRTIVEPVTEGNMFGHVQLLANERRVWPATAVAWSDCEVAFIDLDWMLGIKTVPYISYERFLLNILRPVCSRTVKLFNLLTCFRTKSVRGKLSWYIYFQCIENDSTTITLAFDRDELSELLAIPRPSLSRELANMKRDLIIDYFKNSIKVLDFQKLKRYMY